MSSLLIFIFIAISIIFSNHSSKATNLPESITDNNKLFSVSGSSCKLECRVTQAKPNYRQETKGHHRELQVLCPFSEVRCAKTRRMKQIRRARRRDHQYKKKRSSRYLKIAAVSKKVSRDKFFFPPPWFFPLNPFAPPSIFPPNPFAPPPSIFPPNPFQPPPPSIFPPNPFQPPPPSIFPPLPFQPPPAPPPSIFPPLFPQPPPAPPPSIFPPNPFQPSTTSASSIYIPSKPISAFSSSSSHSSTTMVSLSSSATNLSRPTSTTTTTTSSSTSINFSISPIPIFSTTTQPWSSCFIFFSKQTASLTKQEYIHIYVYQTFSEEMHYLLYMNNHVYIRVKNKDEFSTFTVHCICSSIYISRYYGSQSHQT